VVDTQRCLRVSGKHNDLVEVGIDTYHHTMFEMLGNWSFGDYFKKEAIAWGWELLTDIYKIDKNRLYVTVFGGDEKEGLPKDMEAFDLWKQFVPEDHILFGSKKDNFWEMGETGPCGPCSEIHFDNREESERIAVQGSTLVNADHPQVIEIWNLVFMQFNRLKDGSLQQLPAQHVDTGMGFERLVRVLQGKSSNYDTDVFQPLIQFISQKSGKVYNAAAKPGEDGWNEAVAMRVISDHVRAISFAVSDGQLPSNNKAGYVIRRILRRGVRYSYQYLGFKEPFINQLVPLLAEEFKDIFEELWNQKDFVQKVVLEEELSFLRTLGKGISMLDDYIDYLSRVQDFLKNHYQKKWAGIDLEAVAHYDNGDVNQVVLNLAQHISSMIASPNMYDPDLNYIIKSPIQAGFDFNSLKNLLQRKVDYEIAFSALMSYASELPGTIGFELYDTYGFPKDLTELILKERGFQLDNYGFEISMNIQKARSRAATAIDTGDWVILKDEDTVEFTGYDELESIAHIIKYRKVTAKGKEQYQIVLDKTPFYAESGGQVGDKGELVFPNGDVIEVTDTKKENGLVVHFTDKLPETPEDALTAIVNAELRTSTENNHSATHLLHAAMKQVLGKHVNQKGSLVNADYLRFDFSHFAKVTDEELAKIEAIVNEKVRENIFLKEERNVPYQLAISSGVTALFGEKYGDFVRVITFEESFSKELCGGTHVKATGQIGFFKIVTESAVAAGVRRIEAITGIAAENFINEQSKLMQQLRELLKNPADVSKTVTNLLEENAKLKKEIEKSVLEKLSGLKTELAKKVETINGISFIAQKVELPNADAIKNLAYQIKDIVPNLFLVLAAEINDKPSLTVMISENLVKEKGLNAGAIVRELAKEIKGGGGGQPFFATAGGSDAKGLGNALETAKALLNDVI
jgi:alanyl-tRNA synthetase